MRVSLLGHGKLIRGQNTTVEIQLVTVFMEPLQAAPTQTSPVWVYHLQRRAMISSPHCQPYISAVPPPHAQDDPLNRDGERETT